MDATQVPFDDAPLDSSTDSSTDNDHARLDGEGPLGPEASELSDLLALALRDHTDQIYDAQQTLRDAHAFFEATARTPHAQRILRTIGRSAETMGILVRMLAIGRPVAESMIQDPVGFAELFGFDLDESSLAQADADSAELDASRNWLFDRSELIYRLGCQLEPIDDFEQAHQTIRRFHARHQAQVAYLELVGGFSPERVGRMLADIGDAAIAAALQYSLGRLTQQRGRPLRPDGTTPEVTVIGLGQLGGRQMGYASPMKVLFFFDAIDHNNVWHRDFYASLVDDVVRLLRGDRRRPDGLDIDLRENPRYEVGVHICGAREAARIYETSGALWQRLSLVKARVVAGSPTVGRRFLDRLTPWVYRQFVSRSDVLEIRTLRHKITRRIEQALASENQAPVAAANVIRDPGGRQDVELAVGLMQVIHGGHLESVRCGNTYDAIAALRAAGCLGDEEATDLSEQYARLSRLQHQLTLSLDIPGGKVPDARQEQTSSEQRSHLAWCLGIRQAVDDSETTRRTGDADRFSRLLEKTFATNQQHILEVLGRTPDEDPDTPVETEIVLDPDPDADLVRQTLESYGLRHADQAMKNLDSLGTETVRYLSPDRCRHVLASIAPALLKEVSRTPDPDAALASLVSVTDSLGAKATLWELIGGHHPTMQLMVRLCASTPYLSDILTDNPGMIDELIDSLVINRLPTADRLDAHSIELCKGAADIDQILAGFKSSAHLMIGVHDILGKETLETTHRAIGDTAEACIRRMIAHEQESLAAQFGDPVAADGSPSEMVAVAMGKLGGREPNYHSDMEAVFFYSAPGQTKRRIGGRRTTTTNDDFFSQLAARVIHRINHNAPGKALYELHSPLQAMTEDAQPMAITVDEFLRPFVDGSAPLAWWLALCKSRTISGTRLVRRETDAAIADVIQRVPWQSDTADRIRALRLEAEATALPENLKRGEGGTMDVETIVQMLTLRHAAESPQIMVTGTTASLAALATAGYLSVGQSRVLTDGYRTLRRIEASLRLMKTRARHTLPDDAESMRNLAFLINETDPGTIGRSCGSARQAIRRVFDEVFDR